jgi:hypothetical protein
MIRKSDRLDEYVRQATQFDDDQAAALADPAAKQALFEEIIRMPTSDPQAPPRQPTRRRIQLAAGVVAAVAVVGAATLISMAMLDSGRQPPPVASSPTGSGEPSPPEDQQGDVFGADVGLSCVEEYSPQTVAQRGFAFDGTVVGVGERSSGTDVGDPYVPVSFTVHRWFRGGPGDQVTVAMFAPDEVTSVENTGYAVGSRLLVSGEPRFGGAALDDPIAWACGFTRWYNEADAQTWEQAFN